MLSEEELIEYAKTYLKARGFRKKNKRWTKDIGEFTLCFYLQGSCYSKEAYYIRPGVFINALPAPSWMYGHFMTEIPQTTAQEVLSCFEQWCAEWADKRCVKQRLEAFLEWEDRNPLENRRMKLVDYDADPVPAREFFSVDRHIRQYILENF